MPTEVVKFELMSFQQEVENKVQMLNAMLKDFYSPNVIDNIDCNSLYFEIKLDTR